MNDTTRKYDVAITGGGLGGLTLAIQCADAGYNTVLFEKEKYPFHKVCGEYISFESYPFLQRLGLNLDAYHLPSIQQLELSDINGKQYTFPLPLGGFGISRFTLDNALYNLALSKGVEVFTGTKVNDIIFSNDKFTIDTSKMIIESNVAVVAFGKRSNLDIKWKRPFITEKPDKLNNWIGVKYHIRYPYPKEKIALHNFHNGYCGISNIEEDACCLCYLTTAENLKSSDNSIAAMEEKILWQNPQLKKIFNAAAFLYPAPLVISQVSFSKKYQVENHLLLIGDAAGLITPLCGNGMSMAMHAGKIAFDNISAFLKQSISRSQMEAGYTKQWQQQFSKRLFIGRAVQKLFGSNTTTSLFLDTMHKLPLIAKQVIKTTHGKPF